MTAIRNQSDTEVLVNNKMVYRDGNGNWVSTVELTAQETEALHKHLNN